MTRNVLRFQDLNLPSTLTILCPLLSIPGQFNIQFATCGRSFRSSVFALRFFLDVIFPRPLRFLSRQQFFRCIDARRRSVLSFTIVLRPFSASAAREPPGNLSSDREENPAGRYLTIRQARPSSKTEVAVRKQVFGKREHRIRPSWRLGSPCRIIR